MLTFVICLVVVGVACAAVFRITFGDDDQRATAPKQRHREPPLVDPGQPAPGPATMVPGPDPTALEPGDTPPPAVGLDRVPFDDEAVDDEAVDDEGPVDDAAVGEGPVDDEVDADEPTVALRTPVAGGDTVEVVPDATAPLPDGLVPATGSAPASAFTTDDEISVRLRPEGRTNGTAPYPTPGPEELVPDFGATALPWGPPPAAGRPAPDDEPTTSVDAAAPGREAEPDTAPAPVVDDRTRPVPTAATSPTALLQEPPSPRPAAAPTPSADDTAVAEHATSGDRISTVVVVDDTGGRRLRSGVALLLTVTLVGVMLAVAIGVSVALAVYALRSVITG